jgi:hypothetical protein
VRSKVRLPAIAPRSAERNGRRLVDAEVFGDAVYAYEPEDEQRDGERADDREHSQEKSRGSVGREPPWATWQPPGPDVSRERFGRHRT